MEALEAPQVMTREALLSMVGYFDDGVFRTATMEEIEAAGAMPCTLGDAYLVAATVDGRDLEEEARRIGRDTSECWRCVALLRADIMRRERRKAHAVTATVRKRYTRPLGRQRMKSTRPLRSAGRPVCSSCGCSRVVAGGSEGSGGGDDGPPLPPPWRQPDPLPWCRQPVKPTEATFNKQLSQDPPEIIRQHYQQSPTACRRTVAHAREPGLKNECPPGGTGEREAVRNCGRGHYTMKNSENINDSCLYSMLLDWRDDPEARGLRTVAALTFDRFEPDVIETEAELIRKRQEAAKRGQGFIISLVENFNPVVVKP